MFSQRQLQQQLLQLQQMLQQQQQQQQQSLPPPPSRGTISSQQQQMLNLRPTGQASLLNANPMLQQALLIQQMQGNLRGFSMAAAPVLQQFFPQATRHSLLGPPPVGVSLKPTRLAFPNLPFQRQNRTFRKEFPKIAERKREADSAPGVDEAGLPVLEGSDMKTESYLRSTLPSETPIDPSADGEPEAKRLRSSKAEDSLPEEIICLEEAEGSDTTPLLGEAESKRTSPVVNSPEEKSFIDELKTSEVVNSAGSLKVTIQRSSESRAISTTALKPAHWTSETGVTETSPESALKFYCYICKTDYCNQQNFQSHMAGAEHQQRLQEIQRVSNICVVSLLPVGKEQRLVAEKDGETPRRWCNTCQVHFTGDLIQHRRTQEHKLAKRALCPVCTVCSRRFKTPRKFVEHMKSLEHKQKAKEVRLVEKEQVRPEDSEELITVDAVGCFEEEEEEDEEAGEGDDSDVEIQNKEFLIKQAEPKEILLEDSGDSEEYCPDTVYGPDFLVPVAGFLCRLCHKFYPSDSAGRLTHCKSLMHFENLQRYKAMKLQAAAIHPEASLDLQQQRPDAQQSTDAANMLDKSETDEFKAEDATLMGDCRSSIEESIPTAQTHSPAAFESCNWEAEDGSESGNRLEVGVLWKEAAGTGQASEPTGKPGFKPKPEFSPDEAEPAAANEASDSQELDPSSSPAKGDSSSGRRRYTRRRPR